MLKVALRDLLQDFVASEPFNKVYRVYTYLFVIWEVMRYVVVEKFNNFVRSWWSQELRSHHHFLLGTVAHTYIRMHLFFHSYQALLVSSRAPFIFFL